MANNCLITKLKGNVNNPKLPVFDAVIIDMTEYTTPSTINRNNCLYFGSGVTVKATLGTFDVMNWNGTETVQTDATEYLSDGNSSIYFKSGGRFALVGKSSALFSIETINTLPISDTYFPILYNDTLNYSMGNINLIGLTHGEGFFKPATLLAPQQNMIFYYANWDYTGWNAGSTLSYTRFNYGKIKNFSFEPFQSASNLINLGLQYLTDLNDIPISGSINELFDYWFQNGKTSGSVEIELDGTNITLNNNIVNSTITVNFSASGWSVA